MAITASLPAICNYVGDVDARKPQPFEGARWMKPRHPRGFALERPRLPRWAPPLFGHGMALFGAGADVPAP